MGRPILYDILHEMFKRVGRKYRQPIAWVEGWQDTSEWTKEEAKEFKKWIVWYLTEKRKAGKFSKYDAMRLANNIILNYGWKIKDMDEK